MTIGYIWQTSAIDEKEAWGFCLGSDLATRFSVTGPRSAAIRALDWHGVTEFIYRDPMANQPGFPLTWQQAQERYDKKLPVETLKTELYPDCGWCLMSSLRFTPTERRDWTYRIPPKAEAKEVVLSHGHTSDYWYTCYQAEQSAARQVIETRDRKIQELHRELADMKQTLGRLATS